MAAIKAYWEDVKRDKTVRELKVRGGIPIGSIAQPNAGTPHFCAFADNRCIGSAPDVYKAQALVEAWHCVEVGGQ